MKVTIRTWNLAEGLYTTTTVFCNVRQNDQEQLYRLLHTECSALAIHVAVQPPGRAPSTLTLIWGAGWPGELGLREGILTASQKDDLYHGKDFYYACITTSSFGNIAPIWLERYLCKKHGSFPRALDKCR